MLLLDEAVEADRKVKILSQRLDELKSEEIETQYQVLQHTAGVLCLGLQNLENNNSVKSPLTPIATPTSPGDDQQQSDRLKQKVHALKSELGTMTNTLINMLKRYDLNFNNEQPLTATDLLDQLENQLKAYKSESKKFESQLSAAEERYRIESMSEKKLEIQLRAAQSKNQAAEQKYNNLQKEMDDLLEQMKKPSHEDWLPQDDFDFADDSNTKMEELETELATAKENQQRVDRELEMGYKQVAQLKATVSEMELASSKIQSQVAVFQSREDALKSEMEQYRTQVFDLRTDKEKWERTMKRRTIMQVMDGTTSSTAIQEKYEQQLEEQEQEYQAQLKEQAAFLDKTTRQCEQLNQEHAKLSATCQDLELLIRDKTRALDARDVQVSQLEAQLQQQQQQQMANTAKQQQQQRAGTPLQHEELIQLQQQFSAKESAWIESSTAMEANFEGILKEFDRLTGTAMEFETDRRNYERRIENLSSELSELEASLLEEKTKNMGYEKDTPTTASLRKEFRKMINDMKADHQRALEREGEEKKKLEKQLKDLKHEREMSRYERMTKGVQTLLMP
jgi:chromosome segregation ATPase